MGEVGVGVSGGGGSVCGCEWGGEVCVGVSGGGGSVCGCEWGWGKWGWV